MSDTKPTIETVLEKIAEMRSEFGARLDRIENGFGMRLGRIEDELKLMNKKFDKLAGGFLDTSTRIEIVEDRVSALEDEAATRRLT